MCAHPQLRTDWTTPTTAKEVPGQSDEVKSAPIGSRPERNRATNVSLITATGALCAPSAVSRSRPLTSRTPAVARYPGLNQLMPATSGVVGDVLLPSTPTVSSHPRLSKGRYPTSAAPSTPGIALAAARSCAVAATEEPPCGYQKLARRLVGSTPSGTAESRCKLRKRSPAPVARSSASPS